MESLANFGLLDQDGKPFSSHIERVLRDLAPRLRRQFTVLRDEVVLIEVLEEAGRRIVEHERQSGPIEKLHGYAWVTVRSVATSRLRRGPMRLEQATLYSEESRTVLSRLPSDDGTPEAAERTILLNEILARLSSAERMVCIWKKAGFSSSEIGARLNMSAAAVDSLFHRVKARVARDVTGEDSTSPRKHENRTRDKTDV